MKTRTYPVLISVMLAICTLACVTLFPNTAKQRTPAAPPTDYTESAPSVPSSGAGGSGQIIFVADDTIHVINADGTSKQSLASGTSPTWSPDGTQIAYLADPDGDLEYDIYLMNADGTNQRPLSLNHPEYDSPKDLEWQSSGNQLIFAAYSGVDTTEWDVEIFSIDVNSLVVRQLTRNRPDDWSPTWSPDGTQIAHVSSDFDESLNDYSGSVYLMNADGSGSRALTFQGADDGPVFSPDGSMIAFISARLDENGRGLGYKLFVMNVDGSGQRLLTDVQVTPFSKLTWSPDGQWIAFDKWSKGSPTEIYLIRVDGSGLTLLTTGYVLDWRP